MTRLPAGWLGEVRDRLQQPPLRPRVPLLWRGRPLGSVEPGLVERLHAFDRRWRDRFAVDAVAAHLAGDQLQPTLDALALSLRDAGLSHVWRDEQLPVCAQDGAQLATIERAAVRPLGIATSAVHLIGLSPDGRHWVQLRSLAKANDPGLWDTLMGGMVPAGESVLNALERETWEEAGLRLDQLAAITYGGRVQRRGPTGDGGHGYVVEGIDWYRCEVPDGVVPANRDGEVERFECLDGPVLRERLLADAFTLEAAAIFAQALEGPEVTTR